MMELQLTVNRLVNTVQLGLAVRNTSQTGTGQETQATGNDTGLIGDDIPNRLLVTTTPFSALGFLIMSIAAESIRWVPDLGEGTHPS